ncbi:hypothetical protein MUK42_37467 [Musa troglodytarum]|uniref:Uncharacterized protein n=1 Tax=Musa troglodytarum TaxID=320322 RepID=A0A9E7JY80_9LILI|nr:hypothetical protein MUK42_37467 [Musa troglodytarum]
MEDDPTAASGIRVFPIDSSLLSRTVVACRCSSMILKWSNKKRLVIDEPDCDNSRLEFASWLKIAMRTTGCRI